MLHKCKLYTESIGNKLAEYFLPIFVKLEKCKHSIVETLCHSKISKISQGIGLILVYWITGHDINNTNEIDPIWF